MKASLTLVLTAVALALAAPTDHAKHVVHERRSTHSPWEKRGDVDADFVLPMRIGLTQSNLDRAHDRLMEMSDPRSSTYGEYLSAEEVHDFFAPSAESVDAVRAWLDDAGIAADRVSRSPNKQWLQFDASTSEVEDLLQTSMHIYEHGHTGQMSVGCDAYHVPAAVTKHIDYIVPGLQMLELRSEAATALRKRSLADKHGARPIKKPWPRDHALSESSNLLEFCTEIITPYCILAMYNITNGTTATPGNELGIYELDTQWVDHADMDSYYEYIYPRIPNGTFPTIKAIDGAMNVDNSNDAGTEALLDFQISYPIIYPQKSIMFLSNDLTAVENPNVTGLFNIFLDAIDGSYCSFSAYGETGDAPYDPQYPNQGWDYPEQCGVYKPTNVISLSYGLAEYNSGTTEAYQKRQCLEYAKLGMQGTTVVFASGDNGVGSDLGCAANSEGDPVVFNPDFPANCPYVTAVGATALNGSATADQETAVTQFGSGGGFANFWPRPSWQHDHVQRFFDGPNAPSYPYYTGSSFGDGLYNRSGRGYPDLAAVGQNVANFGGGEPYLVGGTSAAAPVFAAMVTRINEERLAAGKSTVGFVNPVLYHHDWAFHDITEGTNPGCNTPGFEAGPGWDPLTGLGTPDYPKLLQVFMSLK